MIIALTPIELVDAGGVEARQASETRQLGISPTTTEPPEGFQDWGLVWFCNHEYYMSSYQPKAQPDEL